MTGKPAYDRQTYLADIRTLRARDWTWQRIARELGLSVRTVHRIVKEG